MQWAVGSRHYTRLAAYGILPTAYYELMDLDEIKRILDLMRENDLAEFELEQEGVKVRLRKNSAPQWNSHAPVVPAVAYAPLPAVATAASAGEPASSPLTAASEDVDLAIIKSPRSEEHTSELQSQLTISYAVFCL